MLHIPRWKKPLTFIHLATHLEDEISRTGIYLPSKKSGDEPYGNDIPVLEEAEDVIVSSEDLSRFLLELSAKVATYMCTSGTDPVKGIRLETVVMADPDEVDAVLLPRRLGVLVLQDGQFEPSPVAFVGLVDLPLIVGLGKELKTVYTTDD